MRPTEGRTEAVMEPRFEHCASALVLEIQSAARRVVPKIGDGVRAAIEEAFVAHKNVRLHESVGVGAFHEAAAITDIKWFDFDFLVEDFDLERGGRKDRRDFTHISR
jgi:hypothetical protein